MTPTFAGSAEDAAVQGGTPHSVRLAPQFNGSAGEYFGIWFVNVILSIVTLGIYSAWAKVRTERYFYANTSLAGASFEYLASPIAILKGRLIAFAVIAMLFISARLFPLLNVAGVFGLALAWPALAVLTLRFRARNSAWRGLRFRFNAETGDAYGPFLGWRILTVLSLTLLYPVMKQRQQQFLVDGHSFGQRTFRFFGETDAYYRAYFLAAGVGLVGIVLGALTALGLTLGNMETNQTVDAALGITIVGSMVALYGCLIVAMITLQVRYHNLLWNNTRLGEHRFESTLRARDMLWLYLSNALAIPLTLGLAAPWASIRLARYRASHFAMLAAGSLDEFVAVADREHGAVAAEMLDFLDPGIELGI